MFTFDLDIAPPPPWALLWTAAALLSALVLALALWPSREVSEARVWVRGGESCQYVPVVEVAGRVACQ